MAYYEAFERVISREEIIKTAKRALASVITSRLVEESNARFIKNRFFNQFTPTVLGLGGNLVASIIKERSEVPEELREFLDDMKTAFDFIWAVHLDNILAKKAPYGWCPDSTHIRVVNLDQAATEVVLDGRVLTSGTDYSLVSPYSAENFTIELTTAMPKGRRDIIVRGNTKAAYIVCYV